MAFAGGGLAWQSVEELRPHGSPGRREKQRRRFVSATRVPNCLPRRVWRLRLPDRQPLTGFPVSLGARFGQDLPPAALPSLQLPIAWTSPYSPSSSLLDRWMVSLAAVSLAAV